MIHIQGNRKHSFHCSKVKWALIFLVLISASCIDEYLPEIHKYENLLVVDGKITNGPGPFTVQLSLSTSVNLPKYTAYTGCTVFILDNEGTQEELTEVTDGIYQTAPDGIEGIAGRNYKIKIISPEGENYESDFEELKTPVAIDTLYANLEYQLVSGYSFDLPGYQFYINTVPSAENDNYFLWQLEKTFQYTSDYFIKYYFENRNLYPFQPTDSLSTCWKTEMVDEIILYNTYNLSEPVVEQFPLLFVSTETRELSIRYSLLVKQLTISKETYDFWESVQKQNSGEVSLYTQQLYHIRGNIRNTNDPGESVLGYFTVAGESVKRIFVNRPAGDIDFYYPVCVVGEGEYDAFKYIRWTDPNTWPLYVCMSETGQLALPHAVCTDCRERGGDIINPGFWTDP